jgi:hypothetical protein
MKGVRGTYLRPVVPFAIPPALELATGKGQEIKNVRLIRAIIIFRNNLDSLIWESNGRSKRRKNILARMYRENTFNFSVEGE